MMTNADDCLATGSGDSTHTEPPPLRYQDQTPISKQDNKRSRTELSPLYELSHKDTLQNQIEKAVEKSLEKCLPRLNDDLLDKLKLLIKNAVNTLKTQLQEEMTSMENKMNLKMMSEIELLENYNRRENIRIVGLPESVSDENGKFRGESCEETMQNVVELTKLTGAEVTKNDISIAHRLPGPKGRPRPVIVRFSRRMARLDILRKKKNLRDNDKTKSISVFEDLTQPRVQFFNLMKQDTRIASVWTREGTINFYWKNYNKLYRIRDLYDGGQILNYNFACVNQCFNRKE